MAPYLSAIRHRIASKLGVCPFCIRFALRGAALAWCLLAGLALVWPNPVALGLALLVAAGFSFVALAHITAHLWRVAGGLRDFEHELQAAQPEEPFAIGRRRFLATVARAGLGFTAIALGGNSLLRLASAQGACANTSLANPVCAGGADDNAAIANLVGATRTACDGLCGGRACAAGSKCLRSGPPIYSVFDAQCSDDGRGGRICCVRVECPCGCKTCADGVPADTTVTGKAGNKGDAWSAMKANAEAACVNYCAKVDSCQDPKKPNCKVNGTAKVEADQKKNCIQTGNNPVEWTCTGTITKCPCKCR
jgi:hypothetical protein